MKLCSRCKQEKDNACFYTSKTLPMGLRSACKQCESQAERNLERDRSNNRRWFIKNKQKRREWSRKRKYGISRDDFEFIFGSQERCCGICGVPEPGTTSGQWDVDHDHTTNRVRGVLCHSCNMLLGGARDSVEILQNAIQYLGGKRNVINE